MKETFCGVCAASPAAPIVEGETLLADTPASHPVGMFFPLFSFHYQLKLCQIFTIKTGYEKGYSYQNCSLSHKAKKFKDYHSSSKTRS
jgi:hypothetical protein